MKTVFRYEVPLDDKWHTHKIDSDPLPTVECDIRRAIVSFWAENTGNPPQARSFRVFGTGHPVPDHAQWVGTAPRVSGLVFHLYEDTRAHVVDAEPAERALPPSRSAAAIT